MNIHKQHMELAGLATVGPKGQIVIPAEVREKMALTPGDKLAVLYIPHKQSIGLIKEGGLQELIEKMGSHLGPLGASTTESESEV